MHLSLLLGLLTLSLLSLARSAKILAIFPYPGPSQYIVVEPLLRALASRGHELTVLTHHPHKQRLPNYREIKLEYENYFDGVINPVIKIGDSPEAMDLFFEFFRNVSIYTLENEEVQALLRSKNEHFDLVIVEALLTEVLYAIGPHFNAPLIGVSSFGTDPTIDNLVGNPSPISYLPLVTSAFTDRMDFWQRLENFKLITTEWMHIQFHHIPEQEQLYKKYFPHLKMSLQDIYKNFSLVFVNQHFSLSFPRPYVPAMIEVGGMHISQKPKPLPKDIADFINGAKDGVVFFALGSNVKSKDFSNERINAILSVFGGLKERVIWKFELSSLPGKPDNVFIKKWLPQSDILAHPKVKLFITHAGLLSTIEAIHHAKPVVGIPVFYDQFLNMERIKVAGFGVGIDYHTFNESDLSIAIGEVLGNSKYQKVVTEMSKRYHDQPMKPLDKAIYWTEYVLRYKGASHMRVSAQDLSLMEYHSLDMWAYIIVVWGLLPLSFVVLTLIVIKSFLTNIVRSSAKNKRE